MRRGVEPDRASCRSGSFRRRLSVLLFEAYRDGGDPDADARNAAAAGAADPAADETTLMELQARADLREKLTSEKTESIATKLALPFEKEKRQTSEKRAESTKMRVAERMKKIQALRSKLSRKPVLPKLGGRSAGSSDATKSLLRRLQGDSKPKPASKSISKTKENLKPKEKVALNKEPKKLKAKSKVDDGESPMWHSLDDSRESGAAGNGGGEDEDPAVEERDPRDEDAPRWHTADGEEAVYEDGDENALIKRFSTDGGAREALR